MCTVIINSNPLDGILEISSNRDENPSRPSEGWNDRNGIVSPLDVYGGTWIGVNKHGIFSCITNWDILDKPNADISRGHVVLNTLKMSSINDVLKYWKSLNIHSYRPFNIVTGNIDEIYLLSCSSEFIITKLDPGLHILTGLGYNTGSNRELFIRDNIDKIDIASLMASHCYGIGSEDSVCVHDESHLWETRETTIITHKDDKFLIKYKNGHACEKTGFKSIYV